MSYQQQLKREKDDDDHNQIEEGERRGEGVQLESSVANQQHKQQISLPLESSPYLRYTHLEEYKLNAYGTDGRLHPKTHPPTVGTRAPTPATVDTKSQSLSS
ncbi:hypothetical protein ACH5RR_035357 [Cinchona calisaya]|uniref:Uncharacterized protein n=1 Tax=Cinchona calisaya TaxID=153742 RepID=A0ABD2YEX0_9GENT